MDLYFEWDEAKALANLMNNEQTNQQSDDEMRPEYDFSAGVRGKHYHAYQRGYKVIIHKTDGTIEERDETLPDGAVLLDPDVRH